MTVPNTPTPTPTPSGGLSDSEFQAKILGLVQQAATGGGATGASASSATTKTLMDAPIYWPSRRPSQSYYVGTTTPDNRAALPQTVQSDTASVAEAYQDFYAWSDTERAKLGKALVDAGLIDAAKAGDFHTLESAWQDLVNESAYFYNGGSGRQVDPWKVIDIMADPTYTPGGSGKAASRNTHSSSVDLTDPETAKAMVNDVLSGAIGRAANPDEYKAMLSALNRAESASPTVTDSTTNYDATGAATSQSSTTSGGLQAAGKQQVLLDQAMKMPDYGAYQASTSYLNALFSAIRSPV